MRGEPKVGVPVKVKELADSPKMVINTVLPEDPKNKGVKKVETTWFEGGSQRTGIYDADVLEKAADDDKKPAEKKGKK